MVGVCFLLFSEFPFGEGSQNQSTKPWAPLTYPNQRLGPWPGMLWELWQVARTFLGVDLPFPTQQLPHSVALGSFFIYLFSTG